jgi:hypothetical protein
MTSIIELTTQQALIVMPWVDPAVEQRGHDPRSKYAELFLLPVLGPTATWLLRRLVDGLDLYPDGYELDLGETAMALGLTLTADRAGPFTRAFHRTMMFGYVQPLPHGVGVRRMISGLAPRQLERLPPHLRALHAEFAGHPDPAALTRARHTADLLLRVGQTPHEVERALLCLGHRPAVAAAATRDARRSLLPAG